MLGQALGVLEATNMYPPTFSSLLALWQSTSQDGAFASVSLTSTLDLYLD